MLQAGIHVYIIPYFSTCPVPEIHKIILLIMFIRKLPIWTDKKEWSIDPNRHLQHDLFEFRMIENYMLTLCLGLLN
jgi:hypothetical protein